MSNTKVVVQSSLGLLWFAGWLFTLGYLHPGFWRGVLGLLLWPYQLGDALAPAG
ncbi:MAG: hypothetical protein ACU0CY_03470 [Maritimibacter harenae]